jgi:hypothetical protein
MELFVINLMDLEVPSELGFELLLQVVVRPVAGRRRVRRQFGFGKEGWLQAQFSRDGLERVAPVTAKAWVWNRK